MAALFYAEIKVSYLFMGMTKQLEIVKSVSKLSKRKYENEMTFSSVYYLHMKRFHENREKYEYCIFIFTMYAFVLLLYYTHFDNTNIYKLKNR